MSDREYDRGGAPAERVGDSNPFLDWRHEELRAELSAQAVALGAALVRVAGLERDVVAEHDHWAARCREIDHELNRQVNKLRHVLRDPR